MRELFYRRDNKGGGGYKVVAREATITAKEESFGSQKAMPVSVGEIPMFTYKQCCLETGTLMVSCGYIDPHGSRGSGLTHVLMTEDASERAALLDAYPVDSRYFEDVKASYSQENDGLDLEIKPLRIPLAEYLGAKAPDPRGAIAILRETFHEEELLSQVFAALLDAASANPRMVVVVLENDKLEELPEHGRRIAEALFACLPDVVAARVGYQSPSLNLSDVTFSLRFVNQPGMARSSVVFSVQPSQKRFAAPSGVRLSTAGYPEALAKMVMSDEPDAFDWIRAMRHSLSDWTMFGSKNVPQDIAMRFAFYSHNDALTPQEVRQMLDWRHDMVEQAVRSGSGELLDQSAFWPQADRYIVERVLDDMWRHMDAWKRGEPVNDPAVIRTLFEDAQQLHQLGRPEGEPYRAFLAAQMARGAMCPQSETTKVRREMISYFCEQAGRAQDADFAATQLYWNDIEGWIRSEWCGGSLILDGKVLDAVRKLYRFSPEDMQPYVDAYVNFLTEKKANLCNGDGSGFYRAAIAQMMRDNRAGFAASMQRELGGQNPFQTPSAMQKYQWYKSLVRDDPELTERLRGLCDQQLQSALSGLNAHDAEALLEELNGGHGKGFLAVADQLSSSTDAAIALQQRVVSLLRNNGFYEYYPEKRQISKQIADILDQAHAYTRLTWNQKYETLERVRQLSVNALTGDDFDAYIREVDRSMDNKQKQVAQGLLWSAVRNAYENEKSPDYASLLRALAMKSYDGGVFSPSEMMADFAKLNLPEGRFKGFCAKQANDKAEEGLGYLAASMRDYLKVSEKKRGECEKRYPKDEEEIAPHQKKRARGTSGSAAFAGVPTAVPLVGTLLFGGGLAGSAIMLLRMVGLM